MRHYNGLPYYSWMELIVTRMAFSMIEKCVLVIAPVFVSTVALANSYQLTLTDSESETLTVQFEDGVPVVAVTYSPQSVAIDFENTDLTFRCGGTVSPTGKCLVTMNGGVTVNPNDPDNDGIENDSDNCPNDYNTSQVDFDQDDIGDACDADVGPDPDDRDGDGILNDADNCPDAYNEDQVDADNDGIGSACDGTPGGGGGVDAPGAPTNVTASAGNASATVSWTAPSDNGGGPITGYKIERRAGVGTWGIAVPDTENASTNKTVSGLTNGTSYTFRVTAINSAGPGEVSGASNSVTPTGSTVSLPGCNVSYDTTAIDCSDQWGPTLYDPTAAPLGKEAVDIFRGKIRSIPIRMTVANQLAYGQQYFTTVESSFEDFYKAVACTQTDVANNVQNCATTNDSKMVLGSDGVPDFTWESWVSNEPGGNTFEGIPYNQTGPCYVEAHPSDVRMKWTQVSSTDPEQCYLGSAVRTVYFNYRLRDPLGNSAYYVSTGAQNYDFEVRKVVTKDETGQRASAR